MRHNYIEITEVSLLNKAAEALQHTTGITLTIKPGEKNNENYIILEFQDRRVKLEFTAEVVSNPAGLVAYEMAKGKNRRLLVTNYVNPELAERLRKIGIQFIDCVGNAFINTGAIYLFIRGNKHQNTVNERPTHHFNPSGLQIIFVLLCNPDLIRAPYREIAEKAGVALGTVAWVFKDLKTQGYIINIGNTPRRLVKKSALLRLWLVGYEQLLRPRLLVNRYHAEQHDWWINAKLGQEMWGGEVAAYQLTKFLKPEIITLYTPKLAPPLMLENKLRLDPHGEIEIMEPFWNFEYPQKINNLVPPLLVYADLMIRADGRTAETAKIVYERFLARYFEEN
jgi:hypothetical protein